MKAIIRRALAYHGLPETEAVRNVVESFRRAGRPYCPVDQGDALFQLARSARGQDALEIGFGTGSTAAYILAGLESGQLTSIDYDQTHFERAGVRLVEALGFEGRHRLIERDSVQALPELDIAGARFGLVFVDGWKTFDRIWVDTFYCVRMLKVGGVIVFDDAQMPAVRKCISLLKGYYAFSKVDAQGAIGGWRLKLRYLATTRSTLPPYVALRKTADLGDTEAGRTFDFWKSF